MHATGRTAQANARERLKEERRRAYARRQRRKRQRENQRATAAVVPQGRRLKPQPIAVELFPVIEFLA